MPLRCPTDEFGLLGDTDMRSRTAISYTLVRNIFPDGELSVLMDKFADDYPRFKALNITAEMSPAFLFTHPMALASDLMEWDFNTFMDHDAHLTIGSDAADTNVSSGIPFGLLKRHCCLTQQLFEGPLCSSALRVDRIKSWLGLIGAGR